MKLAALLLLAGCDVFFRASEIPPDAPRALDAEPDATVAECTAPPDAHDEDSDQTPDICDPCPAISMNDDRDGDGVGDACDPFPDTPGDALVHFEGFDTNTRAWSGDATWVIDGDMLAEAGSTDLQDTTTFAGVANATVDASIGAYSLDADGAYVGVELEIGAVPVSCRLSRPSVGMEELSIFQGTTTEGTAIPIPITTNSLFRIVLTHNANTTFTCTLYRDSVVLPLTEGGLPGVATGVGFVDSKSHLAVTSFSVLTR